MKTYTIKSYDFNELSEQAKQKAASIIKDIIIDDNLMLLKNNLQEVAYNDYDLQDINLQYSLSFCQGDGLSFNCDNLFDSKYIKNEVYKTLTKNEKTFLTKLLKDVIFTSNNQNYYCFASPNQVQIDSDYYTTSKAYEFLNNKILPIVQNVYIDICSNLEKIGYACYDVNKNDIINYIKLNEYEFSENGNIFTMSLKNTKKRLVNFDSIF